MTRIMLTFTRFIIAVVTQILIIVTTQQFIRQHDAATGRSNRKVGSRSTDIFLTFSVDIIKIPRPGSTSISQHESVMNPETKTSDLGSESTYRQHTQVVYSPADGRPSQY